MGYESKVYIVERNEFPKRDTWPSYISAIVLAEYDLANTGWRMDEFHSAFKRDIDYKLWLPTCDADGNEIMGEVDTDPYGEHMKAADLPDLISALETIEAREHYRRIPPLLAMLKAINLDEWTDSTGRIEAVHYGH